MLSPPPAPKLPKAKKRPDFAGRLKRIYGDKVLQGDVIAEERATGALPLTPRHRHGLRNAVRRRIFREEITAKQ